MQYCGTIQKMQTSLVAGNAVYHLPIGKDLVAMNELVGKELKLAFNGSIVCLHCAVPIKKSYSQGYCYQCSQTLACCDLCIMRPETCHHHLGTCREPIWGLDNCFTPHIVYLANSSAIKVGITRKKNIPARFIDQGAMEFLPILAVDTRLKAGKIEHHLKSVIADKTNWRNMLKNQLTSSDLVAKKAELIEYTATLTNEIGAQVIQAEPEHIHYPVLAYPEKITSLNIDKTPYINATLQGIKGQYLIFDTGVINIRKYGGYQLCVSY